MNRIVKALIIVVIFFSIFILFKDNSYAYCECNGDAYFCYECHQEQYDSYNTTRDCPDCDWCPADNGWIYTCCNYTFWDSDGCAPTCNSGCTPPACAPTYSTSDLGFGSSRLSCTDDCGDTESRTCYCYNCTAPNCPADLSNTDLGFGTSTYRTSCTNGCSYTNYRSCYCRDCTLPIPSGTTLTNTGKQSTLPSYQTTSCSRGTGCSNKTAPLYCTRCTPSSCAPTYATTAQYSTSGVYLGVTTLSCNNTLASCGSESRSCYCYDCIQSCPLPLSNTSLSLPPLPNLLLDDFRTCTTGCAVPRTEDCYESPSDQPEESITIQNSLINNYGFLSLTHSGIPGTTAGDLNDPITMTATYRDPNSASEIEGIFVWFRDDTSTGEPGTPLWLSTTATPQAPSQASWGFMMRKEGNSWVPYVPSYAVNPAVWTRAVYDSTTGRFVIAGTSGSNMVGVTVRPSDIVTNTVNRTVSMRFTLKFSSDTTVIITQPVSEIKYKILLMGLDNFSFTPNDNYESVVAIRDRIDSYWAPNQLRYRTTPTPSQLYARSWVNPMNPATLTNTTWTIDKGIPSISFTNGATPVVSGNTLRINWSATDDKNLYSIVGNIYVSDGNNADARPITLVSSTSSSGVISFTTPFTPQSITASTVIGHLTQGVAFKVASNMAVASHTGSITVDIGANREGSLNFYLTVFDDAGNMSTQYQSFDLDDWFVTDGGLAYSAEGTSFVTKRTLLDWNLKLPPYDVTGRGETLVSSKADLSTEMWAEGISVLDNYTQGVNSYSINGHGGNDSSDYYLTLLEAYEERKSNFVTEDLNDKPMDNDIAPGAVLTAGSLCGPDPFCVLRYEDTLRISDNLRCNTKAVFFVDGNLIIEPPLRGAGIGSDKNAASDTFGCIFVVSGNLIIEEGASASSTSLEYDSVQGYFFIDGQVIIDSEAIADGGTKLPTAIYDGVYINGGIHTQGGIEINRYLRLIDRLNYPVLAIDHHPKYGVLGGMFFGNNFTLQKVETGFKP